MPGARFEPGRRLVRALGSGSRKNPPRRLIGPANPPEGRELVGFAAEYVSFQLNFLVNLVTTPVAAVGEFATSLLAGLTPTAAAPAAVAHSGSEPCSRQGSQRRMGRPQ